LISAAQARFLCVSIEELAAGNEATFRDANERIKSTALQVEAKGMIPFLCECGERRCTELVRLTLEEYEQIRAEPLRFFVVPGHENRLFGESPVKRPEGFLVV
jgi:hypothetical protein